MSDRPITTRYSSVFGDTGVLARAPRTGQPRGPDANMDLVMEEIHSSGRFTLAAVQKAIAEAVENRGEKGQSET